MNLGWKKPKLSFKLSFYCHLGDAPQKKNHSNHVGTLGWEPLSQICLTWWGAGENIKNYRPIGGRDKSIQLIRTVKWAIWWVVTGEGMGLYKQVSHCWVDYVNKGKEETVFHLLLTEGSQVVNLSNVSPIYPNAAAMGYRALHTQQMESFVPYEARLL